MEEGRKEENKNKKLPIIELFGPTIQGEGIMIGLRTHFVRLGGCSFRCVWCDSMHAVTPEEVKKNRTMMTVDEIVKGLLNRSRAPFVTLSGGDPVMHDCKELVLRIHMSKMFVAVETQGYLWKDWLEDCDTVTVSPKGPSSKMHKKYNWDILKMYVNRIASAKLSFKIVIFDDEDFGFAHYIRIAFPNVKIILQAGTELNTQAPRVSILAKLRWLAEKALKEPDMAGVLILPQLHTLIWGPELGR